VMSRAIKVEKDKELRDFFLATSSVLMTRLPNF